LPLFGISAKITGVAYQSLQVIMNDA
jgi:hypothetical protein